MRWSVLQLTLFITTMDAFIISKFVNKCNINCNMNIDYRNKYVEYDPQHSFIDSITNPTIIQGGDTLRTWSFKSPYSNEIQVKLASEGRPLDSDIELWQGPDNVPCKMRVYIENGSMRPFYAVFKTPRTPNTIAIRNIGTIEFPLIADVRSSNVVQPSNLCLSSFSTIQGGALRTYPFNPFVESSQIMLKTDGRPLNSRIELLQGPNNNKIVIELYIDDANDKPFFCVLNMPGSGNVIRIINTSPIEFPLFASVTPNSMNQNSINDPIMG